MDISRKILSDITHHMKYAKFRPNDFRRETYEETVDRNVAMHIKKYPHLEQEIRDAYKFVYERKVLPSMRSMQFAGRAIEVCPSRQYNCSYLAVDDVRSFSEIMFLLLGGTGVGFSVQSHHVEQLPEIRKPNKKRTRRFLIGDSIEGWADAVKALMKSYFDGSSKINFDFTDIRPKGALLVTAGGKAPGPQPLKECLMKLEGILETKQDGDKLSPIEVHDIVCHIADAVLAGGIRRSALISLFDADDLEMISAKTGNWWETNPQRGRANNSAVVLRHKVTKEFFMQLWDRVKQSGSGEPGIYLTNDRDVGTNPSLRKGTKVLTTDGIFPIEELQDKEFYVKNLNGQISKAKCWLSGKNKELFKIKLRGGHEYYATAEHEWPVLNGKNFVKVKTPDIKAGDKLPVIRESSLFNGDLGTYEDGFAIGWQLGDGWLTYRGSGQTQHGFIVSKKDCESGIDTKLISYLRGLGCYANFSDRGSTKELNTINILLDKNLEKFGCSKKENGLPTKIWTASEDFRKGVVDALFSSDGHVSNSSIKVKKKQKSIFLSSKHEKLVSDVSELLGFYGIRTTISKRKTILNGKTFDGFVLKISDAQSIMQFREVFKLSADYKQKSLDLYTFRDEKKDRGVIEVVEVSKTDLLEDVWDICVYDETHCFQLAHCITGNCAEISLRNCGFCNLTEVNVSDLESQEDYENRVRSAAFIGTLQASYTDFHYLRDVWKKNAEKEALLGVSMTGIASNLIFNMDIEKAAKVAVEENKRAAKLLGINPARRVTTTKPSGTSSLILGTSSGIHAWHSDYYIRRIRVGKNESIYAYLKTNHPELVEDEYFRPHDTAVISVPQKAPEGALLRSESPIDFLERVKAVHNKWIKPGHIKGENTHNVSATISIKENDWDSVGEWMWENRDSYTGLSVLPYSDHTYVQAPFEECSKEEYERLFQSLQNVDLSQIFESEDETDLQGEAACLSGNCELK